MHQVPGRAKFWRRGRDALPGRSLEEGLGLLEALTAHRLRSKRNRHGAWLEGRERNPATRSQMSRCLTQETLDKTLATEMRRQHLSVQQVLPWEGGAESGASKLSPGAPNLAGPQRHLE